MGLNPVYKTDRKDALVTWMDFVKLMSIVFFKTADDFDSLHFILKVRPISHFRACA